MEILFGIIQKDGSVLAEDGTIHHLHKRGTDKEGYPKVLVDAEDVDGNGWISRQSIKSYIEMKVEFVHVNKNYQGYNFVILKNEL